MAPLSRSRPPAPRARGRGRDTRFRVEKLARPSAVEVRLGGATYTQWRVLSEGAIGIETTIDDHAFEITTGIDPGAAHRSSEERAAPSRRRRSGSTDGASTASAPTLRAAHRLVSTGGGVCPCCAW